MANGIANAPSGSPDQISNLDQLSQLIMRLPRAGGSPIDTLAASPGAQPRLAAAGPQPAAPVQPVPGAPSAPTAPVPGSTADLESRVRPPTAVQPASPSDDPMISYRTALDQANKNSNDALTKWTADQARVAAVPNVNPADYRPKWYDRLMGAGVGFLTGYGNAARGVEIGSEVTNRRLTRAQSERQATLAPLLEQLNEDREKIPLLAEAQRSASESLRGATEEGRLAETQRRDQDTARYHDDIASIREEMTKGNIQKAQDLLDQKQKELNEKSEVNKNTVDYRNGLLDLRQQMLDLKEKQGDKAKPQQFIGVQNHRDAAWAKARREYNADLGKLTLNGKLSADLADPKAMKQAQQDYYDKLQDAQDEYEQGIGTLGGTAQHVELERNHFGEQPATSSPAAPAPAAAAKPSPGSSPTSSATPAKGDVTPDPKAWKDPSKGLRVKQASGAIQVWKLDNGKPVLVKEEKSSKGTNQ